MPVASLPSAYGVGDFGRRSYEFVDILSDCGVKVWQILPLNPLGFGNSPYQPYSSKAGDEIYIDIEELCRRGLLTDKPETAASRNEQIDYDSARRRKSKLLRRAFTRFQPDEDYEKFCAQEWVYPYAVFMTFKRHNQMHCWTEWPEELRDWPQSCHGKDCRSTSSCVQGNCADSADQPDFRQEFCTDPTLQRSSRMASDYDEEPQDDTQKDGFDESVWQDDIYYEMFIQYTFARQWMGLKKYANDRGIEIFGDIPFYAGLDSFDVWWNRDLFLLNPDGYPESVSGVPPDYFSAEGQRWGNPIYNWDRMSLDDFQFWTDRIHYTAQLFDMVRIDHFRAFDTYWVIPAQCPTAIEGEWMQAPGYAVLDQLYDRYPDIHIAAEDLGLLRPEVYELRDHYNLPGMDVIQFNFDPERGDDLDGENMITYTGTHDNETVRQWFEAKTPKEKKQYRAYLRGEGIDTHNISHAWVTYAMQHTAELAVVPMADVLGLGEEGRVNTPGTVGAPNWMWRMKDFTALRRQKDFLKRIIQDSGRS